MSKYEVTLKETIMHFITIEAENEEDARNKALEFYSEEVNDEDVSNYETDGAISVQGIAVPQEARP